MRWFLLQVAAFPAADVVAAIAGRYQLVSVGEHFFVQCIEARVRNHLFEHDETLCRKRLCGLGEMLFGQILCAVLVCSSGDVHGWSFAVYWCSGRGVFVPVEQRQASVYCGESIVNNTDSIQLSVFRVVGYSSRCFLRAGIV